MADSNIINSTVSIKEDVLNSAYKKVSDLQGVKISSCSIDFAGHHYNSAEPVSIHNDHTLLKQK